MTKAKNDCEVTVHLQVERNDNEGTDDEELHGIGQVPGPPHALKQKEKNEGIRIQIPKCLVCAWSVVFNSHPPAGDMIANTDTEELIFSFCLERFRSAVVIFGNVCTCCRQFLAFC